MNESILNFRSELRISITPVVVVLLIVATAVLIATEGTTDPDIQLYRALLYVVPTVIGLLSMWRVWAGNWFAIVSLIGMILLAYQWLGLSGLLPLVAVPPMLAAALIGPWAAAVAALGETLLLLWLSNAALLDVDPLIGYVLAAIWLTWGIAYAMDRRIGYVADWAWKYYQQAQHTLEKAQDQKVELEQALEDLAAVNQQLRRLDGMTRALRQAAEDARTFKEQFVANVSHELRTPLNMITGFCEIMMAAPGAYGSGIPQALLADLDVIYRNAKHLGGLIDDVLDLSQLEAGQMALVKEYVPFDEIITTAVIAVRPLYEAKNLYLETEVQKDIAPVFCDRTRVREVLLNLLSNAGRFTEQGGVRVRAWQKGEDVLVSIADTGPGIAPQDIDRAFRPFEQLDPSIRRRYGGSGLGLSISKHFIELHGGEVWVESEPGHGTTFLFRLPISPPSPISTGSSRWMVQDWEYLQRTHRSKAPEIPLNPRLVVLDEEGSLQRLLTRHMNGTEIVPVSDMEGAFKELATTPALAFLVNEIPVTAALERLQRFPALPDGTPGIACSMPGALQTADRLGVSDYLVKPISRDNLLAALERLNLKGNTILIVDDEPDALTMFRRMLSSAGRGYRVLRAENGQEGLEILHARHPDAVLLDLVMPGMDGFRLLEEKNRNPSLRDIPTIVISARDPSGQPIVSDTLAITKKDGLSTHQLLACIEAITHILSVAEASPSDPTHTAAPVG